jgi:hypothetical protein
MAAKMKVLDLAISEAPDGAWNFYVPISTGHLEVTVKRGIAPELDRFLQTVLATPLRRFGEDPQ